MSIEYALIRDVNDQARRADEREFVRRLEKRRVAVTVRDTRGRDIDGACGQLAASELRLA